MKTIGKLLKKSRLPLHEAKEGYLTYDEVEELREKLIDKINDAFFPLKGSYQNSITSWAITDAPITLLLEIQTDDIDEDDDSYTLNIRVKLSYKSFWGKNLFRNFDLKEIQDLEKRFTDEKEAEDWVDDLIDVLGPFVKNTLEIEEAYDTILDKASQIASWAE
jgi:hypothetical protein